MDVSAVSQSVQAVNQAMTAAVTQSTEMAEKLVKVGVEMAVSQGAKDPNLGNAIDMLV